MAGQEICGGLFFLFSDDFSFFLLSPFFFLLVLFHSFFGIEQRLGDYPSFALYPLLGSTKEVAVMLGWAGLWDGWKCCLPRQSLDMNTYHGCSPRADVAWVVLWLVTF